MVKKQNSVMASLVGAIGSAKARKGKQAAEQTSDQPMPPAPDLVGATPARPAVKPATVQPKDGLTWREFEIMVGDLFRHQGYSVAETESGADGGVDLELRYGDQLYLVQCKHWKSDVGVKVARELAGVVAGRDATGGFLVASGRFTESAKQEFSDQDRIFLVDGHTLKGMAADVSNRPDLAPPPPRTQPSCPTCESIMVERTARMGKHAGSEFWGCSTYPKCRGTRGIESDQSSQTPLVETANTGT